MSSPNIDWCTLYAANCVHSRCFVLLLCLFVCVFVYLLQLIYFFFVCLCVHLFIHNNFFRMAQPLSAISFCYF